MLKGFLPFFQLLKEDVLYELLTSIEMVGKRLDSGHGLLVQFVVRSRLGFLVLHPLHLDRQTFVTVAFE